MNRQSILRYLLIVLTFIVLGLGTALALILSRGGSITNQGISENGTIRLNIIPNSNFEVFLNEQRKTVSNQNTIDSIEPGEYELKIQSAGYSTWQQKVSVRAGLVTPVSVQLFPEELNSEQLSKSNVDKIFFSNSRRHVYYSVVTSQLGGNIGIWRQPLVQSSIPLIEERSVKITNLTDLIHTAVSQGSFQILPSLDDSKILLIANGAVYVLNADSYNEPSATNQLQFTFPTDEIRWLEGSSKLLIKSGNLLMDYDINRKSSTIVTYQPEAGLRFVSASGSVIYAQGNRLFKYSGGVSTEVKLENIALPNEITALSNGSNSLDNLIIQSDANLFFLSVPESYIKDLGAGELVSVSPSGRNLITKANDVFSSVEVSISAARDVVETVARQTSLPATLKTSNIVWDINSTYFVYQTDGDQKELFSADKLGTNVTRLIDLQQNPQTSFTVLSDNSGIVIKLFDSTEADTQANLYKLKLAE